MKVTVAALVYTDGTESAFGVYQGSVRKTNKGFVGDLHKMQRVGTVTNPPRREVQSPFESPYDYKAMAEQFATPDYPAWA